MHQVKFTIKRSLDNNYYLMEYQMTKEQEQMEIGFMSQRKIGYL